MGRRRAVGNCRTALPDGETRQVTGRRRQRQQRRWRCVSWQVVSRKTWIRNGVSSVTLLKSGLRQLARCGFYIEVLSGFEAEEGRNDVAGEAFAFVAVIAHVAVVKAAR